SAYCAQEIDLPNSPSETPSMPASPCRRTTSATERFRHAWKPASSYGLPLCCAPRKSCKSAGRIRLPTWVVRMRFVECFMALRLSERRTKGNPWAAALPLHDADEALEFHRIVAQGLAVAVIDDAAAVHDHGARR